MKTRNTTTGPTATLRFILTVASLDALSIGITIPVLPTLVKSLAGGDTAALLLTGFIVTLRDTPAVERGTPEGTSQNPCNAEN